MFRFQTSLSALCLAALAATPARSQGENPLRFTCRSGSSALRYELAIDLNAKTAQEQIFAPFADVSDERELDPRQGVVTAANPQEIRITFAKDNYPNAPTDFVLNRLGLKYGSIDHPADAFCELAKP